MTWVNRSLRRSVISAKDSIHEPVDTADQRRSAHTSCISETLRPNADHKVLPRKMLYHAIVYYSLLYHIIVYHAILSYTRVYYNTCCPGAGWPRHPRFERQRRQGVFLAPSCAKTLQGLGLRDRNLVMRIGRNVLGTGSFKKRALSRAPPLISFV